ncbi:MAG TPA: STAS domain-containing protein [Candidatus Tumulicola sp.]|jgi:anti-anti-sigma factor
MLETVIVTFDGEYDIARKEEMRAKLEALASVPRALLDFSRVTYMDSTAVTELLRLHKIRAERSLDRETIVLGGVQKLFELLQLNKVFRLVDSMEDGLSEAEEWKELKKA